MCFMHPQPFLFQELHIPVPFANTRENAKPLLHCQHNATGACCIVLAMQQGFGIFPCHWSTQCNGGLACSALQPKLGGQLHPSAAGASPWKCSAVQCSSGGAAAAHEISAADSPAAPACLHDPCLWLHLPAGYISNSSACSVQVPRNPLKLLGLVRRCWASRRR
jgi:hypothetical protein